MRICAVDCSSVRSTATANCRPKDGDRIDALVGHVKQFQQAFDLALGGQHDGRYRVVQRHDGQMHSTGDDDAGGGTKAHDVRRPQQFRDEGQFPARVSLEHRSTGRQVIGTGSCGMRQQHHPQTAPLQARYHRVVFGHLVHRPADEPADVDDAERTGLGTQVTLNGSRAAFRCQEDQVRGRHR